MKKTISSTVIFLSILFTVAGTIHKLKFTSCLGNVSKDKAFFNSLSFNFDLTTHFAAFILSPVPVINNGNSDIHDRPFGFPANQKSNIQFQNSDNLKVTEFIPVLIKSKTANFFFLPGKQLAATTCFLKFGVIVFSGTGCGLFNCAV